MRRHKSAARDGFTLLELIIVMALIALLAGLGAGAFRVARRNYGFAASAARIESVLRAARNTSISTGTRSFVVVDPVGREVWAQAFESVGEWSFEDRSTPGRVGNGAKFGSGSAPIDCGNSARFDLQAGVSIEAWVRHDLAEPIRPPRSVRKKASRRKLGKKPANTEDEDFSILEKPGAYYLGLTSGGGLLGGIGDYYVETENDVVAPNRWVFVRMTFDGRRLALSADGVERWSFPLDSAGSGSLAAGSRGPVDLPTSVPLTSHALTISSVRAPFPGSIDEVRLRGRSERLVYELPEGQHVVGWTKRIWFDRNGHLDEQHHDGPVSIILVELSDEMYAQRADAERKKKRAVRGGEAGPDYSQTFEEWLSQWDGELPDLDVREEEMRMAEGAYKDAKRKVIEIDTLGVFR